MGSVPINITGPSSPGRSRPLIAQVTRNFYPEIQHAEEAKSSYVLHSFPGYKLFATVGIGVDRGMYVHRETLYKVSGETLYSVNSAGTATKLGGIGGTSRCVFAGINNNVVIVSDGVAWQWNGTAVSQISDADLETPNGAAHINNQIIYDGDGGRFCSSDVGDATAIDGLNYATAESNADKLLRAYVFQQLVYMFGERTIEAWYNSGTGQPPFSRVEGGIIEVGLGAVHAVSHNDRYCYFLGDDNAVYRLQGSVAELISTPEISRVIGAASSVSDANGFCFRFEGQNFFGLNCADRTWCYPEAGGDWFEISSGVTGGRSIISSYAFAHRKHLVAGYQDAKIYELSTTTYDENGSVIVRSRDTGPIHGGLVGAPGRVIEMSRLELIIETGTGLVTGQGSEPRIMLSMSDDGGRTFGTERWGYMGALGEYQHRVTWTALGSFRERILRFAISDPVAVSIHSGAVDVEVGIG